VSKIERLYASSAHNLGKSLIRDRKRDRFAHNNATEEHRAGLRALRVDIIIGLSSS
jgi:hypothetical protein